MQQTLQAQKDKAVQLYNEAGKEGKEVLSKLFGRKAFLSDPFTWVNDLETLCEAAGVDVEQYRIPEGTTGKELYDASRKIIELAYEVFNEGWLPDYSDENQQKWYPYFQYTSSGFRFNGVNFNGSYGSVGSRLCAKNSRIAEHIGRKFIQFYNAFLTA